MANVTSVAIRSDTVSSIEVTAGDVISHLKEIDLQDNLLWNWTEVGAFAVVVLFFLNNQVVTVRLRLRSGCHTGFCCS